MESADSENVKVIEWEDLQQELARLCSLSSALEDAEEKKSSLKEKLSSLIQVEAESLSRLNELDEMREKLEARELVMGNMLTSSKAASAAVKKQEEQLNIQIRSLLIAGTSLSVASKRLQEANRSLAGERGHDHLKFMQKLLRMRQQYMISQVSLLYPVNTLIEPAKEQELDSFPSSSRSGNPNGYKHFSQRTLTISGLQLSMLPFKKTSFFTDKKEVQRSATALGYVAHAVSLIASCFEIPLRYPLRLGGSRSYITDYAPSVEPVSSSELSPNVILSTNAKPMEFPLFLEGQDTTRAAYAVFLLNKDIEQLLNFIGVKSLGPSHVLANLKELLRTVLSPEYIEELI